MKLLAMRKVIFHVVASYSLLTVQTTNRPDEDLTYLDATATKVKNLFNLCRDAKLIHIRRTVNNVAHVIANFAISSLSPFVWKFRNFCFWLVSLVSDDIAINQ